MQYKTIYLLECSACSHKYSSKRCKKKKKNTIQNTKRVSVIYNIKSKQKIETYYSHTYKLLWNSKLSVTRRLSIFFY